jgi:hypothetical protein
MDKEIKQQLHWACLALCTIKCVIRHLQVAHHIPSDPYRALSLEHWNSLPTMACIHPIGKQAKAVHEHNPTSSSA